MQQAKHLKCERHLAQLANRNIGTGRDAGYRVIPIVRRPLRPTSLTPVEHFYERLSQRLIRQSSSSNEGIRRNMEPL